MMNNLLKILILYPLVTIGLPANAVVTPEENKINESPIAKTRLDKVIFQIAAKQWINAERALLLVDINATFNSADLVKARADIMATLNKIAPGEWHITDFNRDQDSSGLDKLAAVAEARVNSADLTNIYQNAKTVSKPGITYSINRVEFKPSLEEEQAAKKALRSALYEQINSEITSLNKALTNQHYTVHELIFTEGELEAGVLQAKAAARQPMMTMMANKPQNAPLPAVAVSNELVMNALVELASNRNEVNAVKSP